MLASRAANQTRMKTPSEFAGRGLRDVDNVGFAGTLLRQVLYAVYVTATDPQLNPRAAREHLRRAIPNYWDSRQTIESLLRFLANVPQTLPHWERDAHAAALLGGAVANDTL
jgi:hypothetical protein